VVDLHERSPTREERLVKAVCVALGCGKTSTSKTSFCKKHFDMLPEELRDPTDTQRARVFLGQKDGYLVPDPLAKRFKVSDMTDNPGSEYV